jgi:multidrug efflux pump subunit AcrB
MGTIGWFSKNPVAANLLMILILAGGALSITTVKQEVFPEIALDLITVTIPYLGASPEEVEEAVCVRVEEAIQGLEDIEKITSTASEGVAVVVVELVLGADTRRVLEDIKSRVDAIDTFPEETEQPLITELTNQRQVIDIAVSGKADERTLRHLAEQVRDDLPMLPAITLTRISNARPYEVSIEVPEHTLRRYGLSLQQVADAVRRSSLDLPGGSVKTSGGEILLRTKGQAYLGREFEQIPVLTRPDGTHLRLGDVANVVDGFEDTDQFTRFDGDPAILVSVFRVGNQDALSIGQAVADYVEEAQARMPEGTKLTIWNDASLVLKGRRDLLLKNGTGGLILIFLTLALFLKLRLAIWVAVGLVISFMGTFWLMPTLGVSINLISLFAFILVLGIVVDDAIVVAENIHTHQQQGNTGRAGAIAGAREVAVPVVFAVLTTVAAFIPLLFVPSTIGKIMAVIPSIVIPCLLWSLIESMWILPAHLSHQPPQKPAGEKRGIGGWWNRLQSGFDRSLKRFIRRVYRPILNRTLRWRYLTLAAGLALLLLTGGWVGGSHIHFTFFPDIEADVVSAAVTLPPGTPVEQTIEAVRSLERSAEQLRQEIKGERGVDYFKHYITAVGEHPYRDTQGTHAGGFSIRTTASHLGELTIELLPSEERDISSMEIAARWRELTGPIPDALELSFAASLFAQGEAIDVQLTGSDIDELRHAAEALKLRLTEYNGVSGIADSHRPGKKEVRLDIKPAAEAAGLTLSDLARQTRQAFYGEEAQRIQRDRDDVRVMVRYPEDGRRSLGDLEGMRIRLPDGTEVPFSEVATVEVGRGYSSITRVDRRRAMNVTAEVDPAIAEANQIVEELEQAVLPEILFDYHGVRSSFEGQQASQRDTMGGLISGFAIALVLIFSLLAIPLRSYAQPWVIMGAIPFGLVGAIWGHVLMGMDLTILSLFGMVALAGVAINDSLVMVDFINRHRSEPGSDLHGALLDAGSKRFRPILLTSVTTFVGLSPLMLEKSMQAQFLIPMAISLAFGVLFATLVTLILVPCAYLILEDLKALVQRRVDPRLT